MIEKAFFVEFHDECGIQKNLCFACAVRKIMKLEACEEVTSIIRKVKGKELFCNICGKQMQYQE